MQLETERLVLRDYKESDVDNLVEGLNNLDVSKWLAFVPFPYTKQNAEDFIKYANSTIKENRTTYNWAIVLKEENRVIGGVTLDKINIIQGTASGGIWLNANYHNKGYGVEAYGKRIEFAFDNLQLRCLDNGFFEGNEGSLKMQEKLGYKIERNRRKGFICMATNKPVNEITTGLLREEWKKIQY